MNKNQIVKKDINIKFAREEISRVSQEVWKEQSKRENKSLTRISFKYDVMRKILRHFGLIHEEYITLDSWKVLDTVNNALFDLCELLNQKKFNEKWCVFHHCKKGRIPCQCK